MRTYEIEICGDCGEECETKLVITDSWVDAKGFDEYDGFDVTACCDSQDIKKGYCDENGRRCTKDGVYLNEVQDALDLELCGESYQPF